MRTTGNILNTHLITRITTITINARIFNNRVWGLWLLFFLK